MIGFEMSEYFFNENVGFLPTSVYIVRENIVAVSYNFTVTVVLLHDSTATNGKVIRCWKLCMIFFIIIYVGSDFRVPGGFNVTIRFGADDDNQPFPLEILEDRTQEGKEVIKLLLTTSGDFGIVRPGRNHTTMIVITDSESM